jgi:hypothetical protein
MKTITVYETRDGKTFKDEDAAVKHELAINIEELLLREFPDGIDHLVSREDVAWAVARKLVIDGPEPVRHRIVVNMVHR